MHTWTITALNNHAIVWEIVGCDRWQTIINHRRLCCSHVSSIQTLWLKYENDKETKRRECALCACSRTIPFQHCVCRVESLFFCTPNQMNNFSLFTHVSARARAREFDLFEKKIVVISHFSRRFVQMNRRISSENAGLFRATMCAHTIVVCEYRIFIVLMVRVCPYVCLCILLLFFALDFCNLCRYTTTSGRITVLFVCLENSVRFAKEFHSQRRSWARTAERVWSFLRLNLIG